MARNKQSVTQRSFLLGELREDFLKAHDLEVRAASLRKARNVRISATRTVQARPGLPYVRTLENAYDLIELRPETGLVFGLLINNNNLQIIDASGTLLQTISPVPWTSGANVWVETFREETTIGGAWGLKTLNYKAGVWTFADFGFLDAPSGEVAQPYWAFYDDVRIQPSAVTGSITVTASSGIFTPAYVGLRIRYGYKEILLTGYVSPTLMAGSVVSGLPPSFDITLASTTSFRTGDAVTSQDTNYQGIVLAISGNVVSVATTSFFDGPDVNENLSSPLGSAKVTAKATIAPLSSPIWDEPLISAVRGYPRAGASAVGRLALVDFPQVPDLVVMSSVRDWKDFKVGARDDDAIARQCGDSAPRFLHAINAGDLLLFSDQGLYYINVRDGSVLTPSTFNVVRFDKRASSPVKPVSIQDGVVFVEANGESIAVALLDGNIYLKWSVRTISTYADHLIRAPIKLCGPSIYSVAPEKYMFVVNSDGTLAAMSWFDQFNAETVGFTLWDTQGAFTSVSPIFGGYWAITQRTIGVTGRQFLERFSDESLVDCQHGISGNGMLTVNGVALVANGASLMVQVAAPIVLASSNVHVVAGNGYYGTYDVDSAGLIDGNFPISAVAGFNFRSVVAPWAVELIQTERAGLVETRVVRGSVSMFESGPFVISANNSEKRFGGFVFGDDLANPVLRTKDYRFMVLGRRGSADIQVIKDQPGPFKILAFTQEVTG